MRHTLLKPTDGPQSSQNLVATQANAQQARLRVVVRGAVQGVGFRPFVFRLAESLSLHGWVKNASQGVFIEVEGSGSAIKDFLSRLESEKPPRSFIQSLESSWLDLVGFTRFEILESEDSGDKSALILPDIATCPDCLQEILDPQNRRYRYPFTNCTNCGPRFSLIEALPYDRVNTSMKGFAMCPSCQREYDDPNDRRFHAQPNACPACGPQLELWAGDGNRLDGGDEALVAAAGLIRQGQIVAVKGVGGFHLIADARNEKTVTLLRERKHREEKPFALIFPNLSAIKTECEVTALEERLLRSPEGPIVLLQKLAGDSSLVADSVAPGNPNLGVMLPSNPLHHLLMADLNFPVVATSGNLSDEPICTDEREAVKRLAGIADAFLVHNRPIVRHEDDSIVRVIMDREMVLRRARGFAPLPVQIANSKPENQTVLAVGAHLKNAVALSIGSNVFISQHIGDLETEVAYQAFSQVAEDLPKLYGVKPGVVVADLHPDYLSTKFALARQEASQENRNGKAGKTAATKPAVMQVQHHVAHVLACAAENEVKLPALGIAWDGTGYGSDGVIWGGEFFRITDNSVEHVAQMRPFRLPGADKAIKQPRRVALGLLYELYGEAVFEMARLNPLCKIPPVEMITLRGMLQRRVNSPFTSGMGRLFDAVASLIDLRQQIHFEGQAAMELEYALNGIHTDETYAFRIREQEGNRPQLTMAHRPAPLVLDWAPVVGGILSDVNNGVAPGVISAKFHNALGEAIVAMAKRFGEQRVILSGGCFQNRYLTERAVTRLRMEKFTPYWHQRVPPNDGGIALGQVMAAQRKSQTADHNKNRRA